LYKVHFYFKDKNVGTYKGECDHQRAETLFNDSKPRCLERRCLCL